MLKRLSYIVVVLSISLVSCKKENNEVNGPCQSSNVDLKDISISNDSLLSVAYSNYRNPSDFYSENLSDTSLYYINTVSVDSLYRREWIELSTNSLLKAQQWLRASFPADTPYFCQRETYRYFEFCTQRKIKARVHKSQYLTRDNFDLLSNSDTLGVFRFSNFCGSDVKELIDYLWYVRTYNVAGSKILTSFFEETNSHFLVHHFHVKLSYGDWGLHDQIKLTHFEYQINKKSGVIYRRSTLLKTLNGTLR